MAELLPGEAVICPDCGRRIGHRRGRIATHKMTLKAPLNGVSGVDMVWVTARCHGSQKLVPTPAGRREAVSDLIRAAEHIEDGEGPYELSEYQAGDLAFLLRQIDEWAEADVGSPAATASDMHRAAVKLARRLLTTQTDGGTHHA